MSQRTIPYGYRIRAGKIAVNDEESAIVSQIFDAYIAGASFAAIVKKAQSLETDYTDNACWNKNNIARILGNEKYTGAGDYPQIISPETFATVKAIREKKCGAPTKTAETVLIQSRTHCACCGTKLTRLPNQKGHERWKCDSCDAISHKVRDTHIITNVTAVLSSLCSASLQSIQAPRQSLDTMRLQNELDRVINDPSRDEAQTKALIMELAAARYALIGNSEYETERIRRILKETMPTDGLNTELFGKIVLSVIVSPDGTVALKLVNEQIIERNCQP
jgi:hypothetical protein